MNSNDKINLIIGILFFIITILILILLIYFIGTQAWAMQLLKNKCIAECIEINKLNPGTCVC